MLYPSYTVIYKLLRDLSRCSSNTAASVLGRVQLTGDSLAKCINSYPPLSFFLFYGECRLVPSSDLQHQRSECKHKSECRGPGVEVDLRVRSGCQGERRMSVGLDLSNTQAINCLGRPRPKQDLALCLCLHIHIYIYIYIHMRTCL